MLTKTKVEFEKLVAKDVMSKEPVSVKYSDNVNYVLELLGQKGFNAFPVVNDKNSLIGVISKTDLVKFLYAKLDSACHLIHSYKNEDLEQPLKNFYGEMMSINEIKTTKVKEIMTTFVYAVGHKTPVIEIVKEMEKKRIHRLYVLDEDGVLDGVISTSDIFKASTG